MHHARATLREQGYRLTPQRNLIWEVLRDAGRHMTAEEVAAEVRRTMPDVNVSTVYRTLELLVSLDLVVETRLEGSACYYEVSPEPTHHHFVCTRCGAVGHFGDELLAPVHDELGAAPGLRRRPDPGDGVRPLPRLPGREDVAAGPCGAGERSRLGLRPGVTMTLVAMHIPDGYLGPQTYVVLWLVMMPIWVVAARKVKRTLKTKQIPLLALGAAFSFVIMMFNVPVVGGSTGHAVGATLIAILLGPWAAVIAISIALVDPGRPLRRRRHHRPRRQLLHHGGRHAVHRLLRLPPARRRRARRRGAALVSGGVGGYVGIVAGAVVAGVLFGIQPYLAHTASGQALYAPYRLDVAVPAMALEHLVFFGPIEAAGHGGRPRGAGAHAAGAAGDDAPRPGRCAGSGRASPCCCSSRPLGALAPGTAWGEWSGEQLKARSATCRATSSA